MPTDAGTTPKSVKGANVKTVTPSLNGPRISSCTRFNSRSATTFPAGVTEPVVVACPDWRGFEAAKTPTGTGAGCTNVGGGASRGFEAAKAPAGAGGSRFNRAFSALPSTRAPEKPTCPSLCM